RPAKLIAASATALFYQTFLHRLYLLQCLPHHLPPHYAHHTVTISDSTHLQPVHNHHADHPDEHQIAHVLVYQLYQYVLTHPRQKHRKSAHLALRPQLHLSFASAKYLYASRQGVRTDHLTLPPAPTHVTTVYRYLLHQKPAYISDQRGHDMPPLVPRVHTLHARQH